MASISALPSPPIYSLSTLNDELLSDASLNDAPLMHTVLRQWMFDTIDITQNVWNWGLTKCARESTLLHKLIGVISDDAKECRYKLVYIAHLVEACVKEHLYLIENPNNPLLPLSDSKIRLECLDKFDPNFKDLVLCVQECVDLSLIHLFRYGWIGKNKLYSSDTDSGFIPSVCANSNSNDQWNIYSFITAALSNMGTGADDSYRPCGLAKQLADEMRTWIAANKSQVSRIEEIRWSPDLNLFVLPPTVQEHFSGITDLLICYKVQKCFLGLEAGALKNLKAINCRPDGTDPEAAVYLPVDLKNLGKLEIVIANIGKGIIPDTLFKAKKLKIVSIRGKGQPLNLPDEFFTNLKEIHRLSLRDVQLKITDISKIVNFPGFKQDWQLGQYKKNQIDTLLNKNKPYEESTPTITDPDFQEEKKGA